MKSAIVALTPRETKLVSQTHYSDESSLGLKTHYPASYVRFTEQTDIFLRMFQGIKNKLCDCSPTKLFGCCENLLVFIFMASRFINICLSKLAVSSLVAYSVMPKFWRGFVMVICAWYHFTKHIIKSVTPTRYESRRNSNVVEARHRPWYFDSVWAWYTPCEIWTPFASVKTRVNLPCTPDWWTIRLFAS
jgi:hypothetical protein